MVKNIPESCSLYLKLLVCAGSLARVSLELEEVLLLSLYLKCFFKGLYFY